MRNRALLVVLVGAATGAAHAAIPLQVNYQGRVAVSGQPFNGNGLFRFTLADAFSSETLWCNDGSVPVGQPASNVPTNAVNLPVINGIFSVRLGDTVFPNMTALPSTVFDSDRVVLRTWFDDGTHGNARLSPDQPITSVAYAFHAAHADTATTATFAHNADMATTASQALAARATIGTYVPTLSRYFGSGTSLTVVVARYAVIGDFVTVWGKVRNDNNDGAARHVIRVSMPFPVQAPSEVYGGAGTTNGNTQLATVVSEDDAGGDNAEIIYTTTGNGAWYTAFTFTYQKQQRVRRSEVRIGLLIHRCKGVLASLYPANGKQMLGHRVGSGSARPHCERANYRACGGYDAAGVGLQYIGDNTFLVLSHEGSLSSQ